MSEIGGFELFSILVRALGYGGGLLAAGSGLYLVAYAARGLPASDLSAVERVMRRTLWVGGLAVAVAVLATLAGFCVRAGHLSGMGMTGMIDPMMLTIVWEGPVGTAVLLRIASLVVLAAGLIAYRRAAGRVIIGLGAVGYALSYTFVGHATEEPRWLLTTVLTVHLLAVSFWFGAFAPLAAATRSLAAKDAAGLLGAFGRTAVWLVALLVAAGAIFAVYLIRSPEGLFGSSYGQILLIKLAIVSGLLGLAALNKLRLVPALEAGDEHSRGRLVRSIRLEALAVVAIFLTTAVLTSVAPPPGLEAIAARN